MTNSRLTRGFMSASDSVGGASSTAVAVMMVIVIPMGGCFLAYLWSFLSTSQLIIYFPLFKKMTFSANVLYFYNIYRPISACDVIPTDEIYGSTFDFSDKEDKPYSDILDQMGYGGTNAIDNLGSVYIFMVCHFILLLVILFQWVWMSIVDSIQGSTAAIPAAVNIAVEGGEKEIVFSHR